MFVTFAFVSQVLITPRIKLAQTSHPPSNTHTFNSTHPLSVSLQVHPSPSSEDEYMWRRYTDLGLTIHREQRRGEGLANRYCDWLEKHMSTLSEQRQLEDSLLSTPNPAHYRPQGNHWIHSSTKPEPAGDSIMTQENTSNTSKLCIIL